jgi:hypothetical protein
MGITIKEKAFLLDYFRKRVKQENEDWPYFVPPLHRRISSQMSEPDGIVLCIFIFRRQISIILNRKKCTVLFEKKKLMFICQKLDARIFPRQHRVGDLGGTRREPTAQEGSRIKYRAAVLPDVR